MIISGRSQCFIADHEIYMSVFRRQALYCLPDKRIWNVFPIFDGLERNLTVEVAVECSLKRLRRSSCFQLR